MKFFFSSVVLLLHCLLVRGLFVSIVDNEVGNDTSEQFPDTCGFFLAPSSIPDAGLGVFSASKIEASAKILNDDVVIHFIDRHEQSKLRQVYEKTEDIVEFLSDYFYDGSTMLANFEADEVHSLAAMVANSHPSLNNAVVSPPEIVPIMDSELDKGAGASSNYHKFHFVSTREIKAGEEIFVPYGDKSITQTIKSMPTSADYHAAEAVLKKFSELVRGEFGSKQSDQIWKLFWMSNTKWMDSKRHILNKKESLEEIFRSDSGKENPILKRIYYLSQGDMSSEMATNLWDFLKLVTEAEPNVLKALPKKITHVQNAMSAGVLHKHVRPISWLRKNGVCLDNLTPKISQIPQAGHGAFTTRKIQEGQVIAPVPVFQLDRRLIKMYKSLGMKHVWPKGHQLLLNYAYGHPESSMLLIPYGPGVSYVNHDAEKFNAVLRWSKLSNLTMLETSASALLSQKQAGLVMELVATRSISEGEEVTIDYGQDWEEAWNLYESSFQKRSKYNGFISASILNEKREWVRTTPELNIYPYPKNVQLRCFTAFAEKAGIRRWVDAEGLFNTTKFVHPCSVVKRQFEETEYVFDVNGKKETRVYRKAIDIEVFNRIVEDGVEDKFVRYDVIVHTPDEDLEIISLPRKALRFYDRSYSSELHTSGAFRHEIQLPDDMVPKPWRDVKTSKAQEALIS